MRRPSCSSGVGRRDQGCRRWFQGVCAGAGLGPATARRARPSADVEGCRRSPGRRCWVVDAPWVRWSRSFACGDGSLSGVMSPNPRVAVLSVHTSPIDQPGTGDSGGMNVYIRAVAERLAGRGLDVDLFTRCRGGSDHEVKQLGRASAWSRSRPVRASRCPRPTYPGSCPSSWAACFASPTRTTAGYDIVHSHYWLSGWVGRAVERVVAGAAGGFVPHVGQGEELLAGARRGARAPGAVGG